MDYRWVLILGTVYTVGIASCAYKLCSQFTTGFIPYKVLPIENDLVLRLLPSLNRIGLSRI